MPKLIPKFFDDSYAMITLFRIVMSFTVLIISLIGLVEVNAATKHIPKINDKTPPNTNLVYAQPYMQEFEWALFCFTVVVELSSILACSLIMYKRRIKTMKVE